MTWTVHAVGGSPAQAVLHGLLEIMPVQPDLVVSGINYGENVGSGITVSGTVGAAMEGASQGVPSLAVSLETDAEHHLTYSTEVRFLRRGSFHCIVRPPAAGTVSTGRCPPVESGCAVQRYIGDPLGDHSPVVAPLFRTTAAGEDFLA